MTEAELEQHLLRRGLEPAYWNGLTDLAATYGMSRPEFVAALAEKVKRTRLVSVIRLVVIRHYREAARVAVTRVSEYSAAH